MKKPVRRYLKRMRAFRRSLAVREAYLSARRAKGK